MLKIHNTPTPADGQATCPVNLTEEQERAYHALVSRKVRTALQATHQNVISRHEEMMEIKQQRAKPAWHETGIDAEGSSLRRL